MNENVELQSLKVADIESALFNKEEIAEQIEQNVSVNVPSNTGMIMDGVGLSQEAEKKNETMQAALENNRMAQIRAMMSAKKQKVREYPKIGRNEKCPCGSGKKYKHCCLNSGQYEKMVDAK